MESSVFGNRKPGDCRKHVREAIIYDGSSAEVPVVENGVLIFKGGISTGATQGIGVDGPTTTGNPFRIEYSQILSGGSGTRIRSSQDSLKPTKRLECKSLLCGENDTDMYIEIRPIDTCKRPRTDWQWDEPILVTFECGCQETCCQRMKRAAKEINMRADYPVTAAVVNVGTKYYLDLTSKDFDQDFIFGALQGFNVPRTIVPYNSQLLTAWDVAFWFPYVTIPLLAANPAKKMTVVEIYYRIEYPTTNAVGGATSNELGDIYELSVRPEILNVAFDRNTAQSETAYQALITALTASNAYLRKLGATTSADIGGAYPYLIVRTDAGDAAALTDARGDYVTNAVRLDRKAYAGGKSYYELRSTSATPPTPDGTDVVTQGNFIASDIPAEAGAITCPEPEDSICVNCG